MINGTIKVTTEELITQAAAVDKRINSVKRHFASMNETVIRSSQYWKGNAGETHRKTFQDKQPVFEEIIKRFLEHTRDLTDMARNYDAVEKHVQERLVQQLPEDVIV